MGPGDNPDTSGSLFSDLATRVQSQPSTGNIPASTGNVSNVSQLAQAHPGIKKLNHVHSSITKMKESLNDSNWVVWRERIRRIFRLSGVKPYVYGDLPRPDPAMDPVNCGIWDINDVYAQILITNNIAKDQMVHVTQLNTAHKIWQSLMAIHKTKDYQIAITIQRTLFRKCASDGDDIVEHLTQLKKLWERLNVLEDSDFRITDMQFKTIIASSLPQTWDVFTEPYVGRRVGIAENNPKKQMSSQEFISILKEEHQKRKDRNDSSQQTFIVTSNHNNDGKNNKKRSFSDHNRGQHKPTGMLCKNCKHDSHITDNCRWLGKPKCDKCGWFGHISADCRREGKNKNEGDNRGGQKKARIEQVNHTTENGSGNDGNEIAFIVEHDENSPVNGENNDAMILYDWLADSATTSHVTNRRDLFENYTPLQKSVCGVGNVLTCAEGKGDIKVKTKVRGKEYNLTLRDVLYIPTTQQNLLSLGRWDNAGGNYHGGQGKLMMNASNGETVVTGTRIKNNLYKLDNFIIQQPVTIPIPIAKPKAISYAFNTSEQLLTWETWHKRYGHLGLSSIQTLLEKNLVTGLKLDPQSPKYECAACTQAKQHVTPFLKASIEVCTKPGEITHTDLWGKYSVQSIHGNQYFHSFLDDSTKCLSLTFLKHKDDATQAIKDYVAYL